MSWPFDTSEPYTSPQQETESQRLQRGATPEEWRFPPTLVATFQRAAHERLIARAGLADGGPDRNSRGFAPIIGAVMGTPVVVARIGIGAPAAAIVLEEAIARGVRDVLIVGAVGSLQPEVPRGSTVVIVGAEREDGTSHHYLPAGVTVTANDDISALLERCAHARGASPVRGRTWTIDAPYRETVGAIQRHRATGVAVVEMEAAAIFAVAQVRGVRAGMIVAVSDELFGERWNLAPDDHRYTDALLRATDAVMDAAAMLG